MSERIGSNHDNEKRYVQASIDELLPRYYEAHGDHLRYETVRSMPIDGHEVAWMKYTGETTDDRTYEGHSLCCACEFAEGVGWETDEKFGVVGLSGEDKCLPRQVALYMRQQELQREYLERFADDNPFFHGDVYGLHDKVPEIIMDLIEKNKAGEFIGEGSNGAEFWGGHFYLQTVQSITGISYEGLWKHVHKMVADKQIQLEGMVVQEYYEPPEPQWGEYGRYEIDGLTIVASIPSHSKMPQIWHYTVLDQDGSELVADLSGATLMHSPDFGVDVDDIAQAEQEMKELVALVKSNREKGLLTRDELIQGDTGGDADIE